jgi:hypothetical protein
MDNNGGMKSTGTSPDSSIKGRCKSYQQSSSSKAGGTGKVNDEFDVTKYLFLYFEEIFNMP